MCTESRCGMCVSTTRRASQASCSYFRVPSLFRIRFSCRRPVCGDGDVAIGPKIEQADITEDTNTVPMPGRTEHGLIILILMYLAVEAMQPAAFKSTLFVHHAVVLVQYKWFQDRGNRRLPVEIGAEPLVQHRQNDPGPEI